MIAKRALLLMGIVTIAATAACKKKAPPPTPPPAAPAAEVPPAPPLPEIHCPAEDTFAPLGGKGRALRTACVVFSPGRYWLATALSYDEKPGKGASAGRSPKLSFLSGSPGGRIIVFDIQPLPVAAIEALIKDNKQVGVQIRRTRDDRSLVRLGITGSSGDAAKPDLRELGMLLQLVAHKPPNVLWTGPGDQVTTEGGCITEQLVEFEMLFRTRLERFSMSRTRPVAGAKPEACAAGPSMQETVAFQGVPLARGRTLGEDAPPEPPKPGKH